MTVKERVTKQLEAFDETELSEIEKDLQSRRNQRQLEEEFHLLDELAAPMSEEDKAAFKEAVTDGQRNDDKGAPHKAY